MQILLLHQYFKTPEQGGGIRSYHIATAMVRAGHDVTVITSSSDQDSLKLIEGVNVHYLKVPYSNHFSFTRRLLAFWRFYFKAESRCRIIRNTDLVYAISTPLSVGWLGKRVSKSLGARFIFEVGDLWPEVPIQMGVVRNPILIKWLYALEREIYRSAEVVIALSSGMVDYIKSRGGKEVFVVPNMADLDLFSDDTAGRTEEFTIGYFGTIGQANQLEYLLDIAEKSQVGQLNVKFIVAGDGARRKSMLKEIRHRGLENVKMRSWQSMQGVKQLMEECDAVYVSFQNIPILHTGSPNKLFDGLAAGKIIVSNLTGWSKDLIESKEVGLAYDPLVPDQFISWIKPLLNDPSRIKQLKHNALALAGSFSKETLTKRILEAMA